VLLLRRRKIKGRFLAFGGAFSGGKIPEKAGRVKITDKKKHRRVGYET